jgi:hypothetical protein
MPNFYSEAKPTPKQKAPKTGRGYGVQGQKWCKGLCVHFEKQRPYLNPYDKHRLCTNCVGTGLNKDGVWQEVENLNDKGRCPCCNRVPRSGPRSKTKIQKDQHKRWEKGTSHKKPNGSW